MSKQFRTESAQIYVEELVTLYNSGFSYDKITEITKISKTHVARLLKNKVEIRNISLRQQKYAFNQNWLDSVDSEEKAYFLGFMYADGNNTITRNTVSISLQEADKCILDKFKLLLGMEHTLQYIPARLINKDQKIYTSQPMCKLAITNIYFSKRCEELGIIANKSLKLKFPEWLDKSLHHHFIRGYFDGDGCVHFNKANKSLLFYMLGTFEFLTDIAQILKYNCNINLNKITKIKNIYSLRYSGNKNSLKFFSWLYKDATIYLERKKEKFIKLN